MEVANINIPVDMEKDNSRGCESIQKYHNKRMTKHTNNHHTATRHHSLQPPLKQIGYYL